MSIASLIFSLISNDGFKVFVRENSEGKCGEVGRKNSGTHHVHEKAVLDDDSAWVALLGDPGAESLIFPKKTVKINFWYGNEAHKKVFNP